MTPNDKTLRVGAVRFKIVYTLELECAFQPGTTDDAIRAFVFDRIAIATSLGGSVKVPRVDILPVSAIQA